MLSWSSGRSNSLARGISPRTVTSSIPRPQILRRLLSTGASMLGFQALAPALLPAWMDLAMQHSDEKARVLLHVQKKSILKAQKGGLSHSQAHRFCFGGQIGSFTNTSPQVGREPQHTCCESYPLSRSHLMCQRYILT
ncbi:hypothetical protein MC885_017175 [Smutsia gigantea]|nr:hypothetical protein MC885_017175 [Smutsia gigantea]